MASYLLYNRLAPYYDLIYASKDYRKQARQLAALIRKYKKSSGNELLEVACGTGRYLEHLEKRFSLKQVAGGRTEHRGIKTRACARLCP